MIVQESEPTTVKNVKILKWGKEPYQDKDRIHETKEETNTPLSEIYVTRTFQPLEVSGKAKNFEKTEDGLVCDIVVQDDYFKEMLKEEIPVTAAPKLEGEPSEDGELLDATIESVSLIVEHAQPSLNGNVNDAYDN